ncbi:hypothetical protein MCELHM10_03393 [Paracoccaceae bacterium]|jgi:hypothetical protein
MPQVLPTRATPVRAYGAIALFVVVYLVMLAVVFLPREMISAQTGAIFAEDN